MMPVDYMALKKEEKVKTILLGIVIFGTVGYLFYESIIAMVFLQLLLIPFYRYCKKEFYKKRLWNANQEFKEFLLSLSGALNAGYSVENALVESKEGLKHLLEEDADMMLELNYMITQLKLNMTVEEIFLQLEERLPIEDVHNFVDIFVTAKRTGGDIIRIIRSTSACIRDKIEVKREIQTMVTAKQFESRIMCLAPMGILMYLQLGSPGYLDPLYHNLMGIFIMTILLGICGLAYYLANRIMSIEV